MLKYDVVIGRTTNNPGTAVDVNALEITFYKSEELDFGVFTIPATTRFENYQILDRVDITVTDGSTTKVYDPFLVISDEVTPVSKKGYYKHTVTFIEDIHKFEKILSSNVFITQPLVGQKKTLLDALNHIRDVVPFERASVHSATRLFDIDSNLATFLDGIEAPQFFFTGMNLREMINAIASYVNAIGRMEENRSLVFSFYNEILDLFDVNEDVINRTLKNQTKYFTSAVESIIENATGGDTADKASIIYPSKEGFVSMRSTDLKLTDESFEFRLPYPIERINKIEYKTRLRYLYYFEVSTFNDLLNLDTNNDWEDKEIEGALKQTTLFRTTINDKYYGFNKSGRTLNRSGVVVPNETFFEIVPIGNIELYSISGFQGINNAPHFYEVFDVTRHIYEFTNYKQLNLDVAAEDVRRLEDRQSNTMHYQINGKTISNNRLSGVFDGQSAIESFYLRVLYENGYNAPDEQLPDQDVLFNVALKPTFNQSDPSQRNDWNEQEFRVTYVPYFGTRVRLNKDDVTDHPYNTQMSANQGERIVSAERLLRNIYGMAQRLGQDEIEFKRFYTDLDEMFELGQITEDGFVIASKQITYYLNYYIVTYLLSKNFNRFANRIALNQENRPFDIGRGSKTTTRNLLYNEYVELDTERKENTSLVRSLGVGTFMNTLRTSPIGTLDRPIRYGLFAGSELADVLSSEGILINPITFSEGNALNFYWSFDDVVKAGDRLALSTYGNPPKFLGIEFPTTQVYNNRNIRYTDNNEELNNFELSFGFELPDVIPDDIPIVSLPSDSLSSIGGHSFNGVFNDNFLVKKDKSEILSMNYILSVLPNFKYNNKIVVGRELTFSNNLIIANKNANLVIYTSENETYNSLENLYTKGTATAHTYTVSIEQGSGKIVATIPNISNLASWAIGDDEGNLYLGVNVDTDLTNTIYFNFRNKRENISYTFDDIDIIGLVSPRNLVLTPTETTIVATWQDDQASDFYEVGIRTIAPFTGAFTTLPPVFTTTATFTGLTQGFTYQVRVRSSKDGVLSFYVSQNATTVTQPAQVQNFTLNRISGNNTALAASWSPVSNVTGYNVQFRLASKNWTTGPVTQQTVGSSQTTTTQGVGVNNILVGRVRGQNAFGFGDFSDEDINVIPLVTGRGATAISDTVIRATWDPLTNLFEPTINQEIGFDIVAIKFDTIESGTTTSAGINQITDSTKSFTPNALVGKKLIINTGAFAGRDTVITSNTATTITFETIGVTSPPQITGVEYAVADEASTPFLFTNVVHTNTFYDVTGLEKLTFYKIRIRAYYDYIGQTFNKAVFSDFADFVVKTLDEQLPANVLAPVITVASGFPTQNEIRWVINNPNNFTVEIASTILSGTQTTTPSSYISTLSSNASATIFFDQLQPNSQWTISSRFRVGTDPTFVFSNVSTDTRTTLPPPPPPTPLNLTITNITQNSATASWGMVQTATLGYDVLVNPGNLLFSTPSSNSSTSISLTGLSQSTNYTAQVRSKGAGGNSSYSSPVAFTTLTGPPGQPSNFIVTKRQIGSFLYIDVFWGSSVGATGYDLNISDNANFTTNILQVLNTPNTEATTFPNTVLPKTYYGRVRAKNSAGDSVYTTTQANIALSAPPIPATATLSKSGVNLVLDWTVSNEFAQTYEYQIFTNSSFTGTAVRSGTVNRPALTSGTIAGLTIGGTYFARIRSVNAAGQSDYRSASPHPTGVTL